MAILKTITTTTPIVDADGVNAFGWLRVRPNAPFEYTDGGAISVTDSIIECQLVDGAIYAVGGVVSADLSLAPNTGASNSPETYYIVDLELNGTTDRQYWRIDSATGGAGSVDVEYVDVPRVPGPDTGSSDTIAAHLAASNPHQQYVLRSDAVAYGGTTTGAASDGLGKIPRFNTSTGKLDPSAIPSTITLADAGTYFTTDNVEAALQELGPAIGLIDALSSTVGSGVITVKGTVINKDAVENLDIIPGTGTVAATATTTGGLRVLSSGSMYYYSGADTGDGFRVLRAHATTQIAQFVVDCGDSEMFFYNATGDTRFYVNASTDAYLALYESGGDVGLKLSALGAGGTIEFYTTGAPSVAVINAAGDDLFIDADGYVEVQSGGVTVARFRDTYIQFNGTNTQHMVAPTNSGAPTVGVVNGSVYFDTSTGKLRVYASGWVDLH